MRVVQRLSHGSQPQSDGFHIDRSDNNAQQQTNRAVFSFGLKVLSQPPLQTLAAQLQQSLKDGQIKKNFYKAL